MKRLLIDSLALVAGLALANGAAAQPNAPTSTKPAGGPVSAKESANLREKARSAVDAGDWAAAERLVQRSRSIVTPIERTAWWLIEAELEYAQKRYAKSALAAMQIVILHPKSEQVGPALFWAGRCYEALGRRDKAATLYDECLANKKTPKGIRDAATRRLTDVRPKIPG